MGLKSPRSSTAHIRPDRAVQRDQCCFSRKALKDRGSQVGCRGQRAASTKQALQSTAGSRRDGCASRALCAGFALYCSVTTSTPPGSPGPHGVVRHGWFEATFAFIKSEGDKISGRQAYLSTRRNSAHTATAAQTHGAQSRDREVVPTKTS